MLGVLVKSVVGGIESESLPKCSIIHEELDTVVKGGVDYCGSLVRWKRGTRQATHVNFESVCSDGPGEPTKKSVCVKGSQGSSEGIIILYSHVIGSGSSYSS